MAGRLTLRLQQLLFNESIRLTNKLLLRSYRSSINRYDEEDPAPIFFDPHVQNILKRLAGCDYNRVFRKRYYEQSLKEPEYKFLTEEELQEYMKKAAQRAETILQMPPVMKERKPITEVISRDLALTRHDTCKLIITDITFGLSDRTRPIFTREPDGTLRHATWEERTRMNEIYNPQPGRKLKTPKMFEDEYLKDVIAREKYEFVLDRACVQFEPDDPEFHRVTSTTYEAINEKRQFDVLHSTRHYGPMCFYLAWFRKMDNLLIHLIQKESLSESSELVHLYHCIHKDSRSAAMAVDSNDDITLVKAYIEEDALRRPQLQLALQGYQELLRERKEYEKNIQTSHGVP